jgi:predicted nuclease with TOPRIM domain
MSVETPEAYRPTELATGAAAGAAPPANATVKGRKGATPKAERPPETRDPGAKEEGSIPLGEIIGERYRLVAHVGAGGQGEVWRAEDVSIAGHVVALKMLFARAGGEAEKDFQLRELRMLASVSHPSVVQFKDYGWFAGRLWFVMPWYEGKDLEKALPLDRAEARRVFEQVAGGLAAVHAKGLRHQDIKPSNVFLAKIDGMEGTLPILLDFGVAAVEGETLVAGSPAYFAPELAAGWPDATTHVGPAADVFALALALRNALDPEGVPEVGAFDRESLDRRAKELIPPPSGKDLAYLAPHFERWMSLDPAKRPTAAELVRELAVLTEPEERRAERRRVARRVAPWVAVGLVVAALGSWWGWRQIVDARKAQADEVTERLEAERLASQQAERAEQLGDQLGDALARADASSQRTTEALGRLDEAQAEIEAAQGNAERLRAARDRLGSALEQARSEIEANQRALTDAQAAIGRTGAELADTRRRLEETRSQLDATRTERESLADERDRLSGQLESVRSQLETSRGQSEALRSELESLRASQQALSSARDALAGEREALRSQLESQRAQTSAAEQRASAAEQRAAAAQAEAARLRAAAERPSGGGTTETPAIDTPVVRPSAGRVIGTPVVTPRVPTSTEPSTDPTP